MTQSTVNLFLLAFITVGLLCYLFWLCRDWLRLIIEGIISMRTWEDALALMLIVLCAIIIIGDVSIFAVRAILPKRFDYTNSLAWIHLYPHLFISVVFLIRVFIVLTLRKSQMRGLMWRNTRDGSPLGIFAIVSIIDTGDYIMRDRFPLLFAWLPPPPHPFFWIQCAAIAFVTWLLAWLAYMILPVWDGWPPSNSE